MIMGSGLVVSTAATPLRGEYKERSAWRLRLRRPLVLPTRPTRDLGSNGFGRRSRIAGVPTLTSFDPRLPTSRLIAPASSPPPFSPNVVRHPAPRSQGSF